MIVPIETETERYEVEWLDESDPKLHEWRVLRDRWDSKTLRFVSPEGAVRAAEEACDRVTWRVVKVRESRVPV